ncbi:MAG TPA: Hsp20 family protein, partial [Bacilli bacterium]
PKGGKYVYRERYVGTASRSFYIGKVKEDQISAKYENGTLTLTMPKLKEDEKEMRWIDIQ